MKQLGQTAAQPIEERRSSRNDVRADGVLQVGTARHAVTVLNVSAHGVMVQSEARLVPGRPVTVELEGLAPTRGRVAWAREGHVGIAFNNPLTLHALLAIV